MVRIFFPVIHVMLSRSTHLLWIASATIIVILACKPAVAAQASKGTASNTKNDYSVGERLPQRKSPAAKATYKETDWDALMPKDWDPMRSFKDLDFATLDDADPRATEALERLRKAWGDAPVQPAMNGARIRIPGFVVPLERDRDRITEFLLVPYFGACIHTPPPPSNQVIHVFPKKPLNDAKTMDAVWVSGVLETVRSETGMGSAGYRMKADAVTAYK